MTVNFDIFGNINIAFINVKKVNISKNKQLKCKATDDISILLMMKQQTLSTHRDLLELLDCQNSQFNNNMLKIARLTTEK